MYREPVSRREHLVSVLRANNARDRGKHQREFCGSILRSRRNDSLTLVGSLSFFLWRRTAGVVFRGERLVFGRDSVFYPEHARWVVLVCLRSLQPRAYIRWWVIWKTGHSISCFFLPSCEAFSASFILLANSSSVSSMSSKPSGGGLRLRDVRRGGMADDVSAVCVVVGV